MIEVAADEQSVVGFRIVMHPYKSSAKSTAITALIHGAQLYTYLKHSHSYRLCMLADVLSSLVTICA